MPLDQTCTLTLIFCNRCLASRWNAQVKLCPQLIGRAEVSLVSPSFGFSKTTNTTRSSHQRCSLKKGVLRNFTKFTGKHLCQSLFFNKVAGPRCFPVNFVKLLRTPFLQSTAGATASVQLTSFYSSSWNITPLDYINCPLQIQTEMGLQTMCWFKHDAKYSSDAVVQISKLTWL